MKPLSVFSAILDSTFDRWHDSAHAWDHKNNMADFMGDEEKKFQYFPDGSLLNTMIISIIDAEKRYTDILKEPYTVYLIETKWVFVFSRIHQALDASSPYYENWSLGLVLKFWCTKSGLVWLYWKHCVGQNIQWSEKSTTTALCRKNQMHILTMILMKLAFIKACKQLIFSLKLTSTWALCIAGKVKKLIILPLEWKSSLGHI